MKFSIIILTILLTGCVSSPQPAPSFDGMTLDQAIAEATLRIEERIEAGSKIAPINFNSATAGGWENYLIN